MNHFATAARRLRLVGAFADTRARHPQRAVVEILVNAFGFAAEAFETVAPGAYEELPEDLADAVAAIEAVFRTHDFGLSSALVAYAIEPVTGDVPVMPSADAISEAFARQDLDLQVRRSRLLDGRHLDSDDDEKVAWALRALSAIHYQHEKLAEIVAADNARPENAVRLPFRMREWREEARMLAAAAGPKNGHKMIAALQAVGIPAWFAEDCGVSYVIAAVDKSIDEGQAHTGPKVFIYCGEQADLHPAEHDEPWACALYDRDGEFVDVLFTAPAGLDLDSECAHAAVQLAHWLERNAEKHPRA